MSDLPGVFPGLIQIEETFFKAAVSEFTMQRMGQFMNFLATKEHSEKQFFLNGPYARGADPQFYADGLAVFEFDAEIFNVWMFNIVPGSSGTTELDIKIASSPGAAFNSIFATTPKITSSAVAAAWIGVGGSVGGCVAPVLTSGGSPLSVSAGYAIRCDKITSMAGGENCGIIVHYRPI
jgi:hypothetical protein